MCSLCDLLGINPPNFLDAEARALAFRDTYDEAFACNSVLVSAEASPERDVHSFAVALATQNTKILETLINLCVLSGNTDVVMPLMELVKSNNQLFRGVAEKFRPQSEKSNGYL